MKLSIQSVSLAGGGGGGGGEGGGGPTCADAQVAYLMMSCHGPQLRATASPVPIDRLTSLLSCLASISAASVAFGPNRPRAEFRIDR